jgi:hypothetical protein
MNWKEYGFARNRLSAPRQDAITIRQFTGYFDPESNLRIRAPPGSQGQGMAWRAEDAA